MIRKNHSSIFAFIFRRLGIKLIEVVLSVI